MEINISGWFGFWVFMIFFFALDTWIFYRGYDSFMQSHKTLEEKQIQKYQIEILKTDLEVKQLIRDSKKQQKSRCENVR